jgi:hypothetical protein
MTLAGRISDESATKQSAASRHCEERSDEAIQKVVYFWIASSLRSSQ